MGRSKADFMGPAIVHEYVGSMVVKKSTTDSYIEKEARVAVKRHQKLRKRKSIQ